MKTANEPRALALLTHLYTALLVMYPLPFRSKFGAQMAQVFQDNCRAAWRVAGGLGLLRVGWQTVWDLLTTALAERLTGGFSMSRAVWVRASGVSLVVAALASLCAEWIGWEHRQGDSVLFFVQDMRLAIGVLFALGISGLLAAQRTRFGPIFAAIALTFGVLASVAHLSPVRSWHQGLLGIAMLGVMLCFYACLIATGVVTLIARPLPRWNVVPLLLGIWTLFQTTLSTAIFTGFFQRQQGTPDAATLTALFLVSSLLPTVSLWLWTGVALLNHATPVAAPASAQESM